MTKPELGTKRLCASCGARFYDLLQSPITCPKCGTVLATADVNSSRVRAKATREPEREFERTVTETSGAQFASPKDADGEADGEQGAGVLPEGEDDDELRAARIMFVNSRLVAPARRGLFRAEYFRDRSSQASILTRERQARRRGHAISSTTGFLGRSMLVRFQERPPQATLGFMAFIWASGPPHGPRCGRAAKERIARRNRRTTPPTWPSLVDP
jgi:uncharacterized protein (TIGR02300 family)